MASATAKTTVKSLHPSTLASAHPSLSVSAKPAQKITSNLDKVKKYDSIFTQNHPAAVSAAQGLMHKLSGRALRPLPPSQSAVAVEKIPLKEWINCFNDICSDIVTPEMRRHITIYFHFISDPEIHDKHEYTQSIQLGARLLINEWKNPNTDIRRKQVVFSCLADLIHELIYEEPENAEPNLFQRFLSPLVAPSLEEVAESLECHSRLLEELYYYVDYLRDAGEGPKLPRWGDNELRLFYKMVAWHATDKEQILLTIFKRVFKEQGDLINHFRSLIGNPWGLKFQTPSSVPSREWPNEPRFFAEVLEYGYTSAHQIQKDTERLKNAAFARLARVALQETIERCISEERRAEFILTHVNDDPKTGFLDKEGAPNQLCVAFLLKQYGFQERAPASEPVSAQAVQRASAQATTSSPATEPVSVPKVSTQAESSSAAVSSPAPAIVSEPPSQMESSSATKTPSDPSTQAAQAPPATEEKKEGKEEDDGWHTVGDKDYSLD